MQRVPTLVLVLFNIAYGVPVKFLFILILISIYGFSLFDRNTEPSFNETSLVSLLCAVMYIVSYYYMNKWFIRDSPYVYELWVIAGICYLAGIGIGVYLL